MTDVSIPVPSILPGLEKLAGDYEGFIIDLWGTLHDGYRPLPGAVPCLEALYERGKRILILSNAPRRAHSVVEKMEAIGIPEALTHDVLSSGEAANRALRERDDQFHAGLGPVCFLLGPQDDDSVLEGVDDERTEDIEAADYILGIGPFDRADRPEDYDELLTAARRRDLPFICANPDHVVLRGDAREICAGAIAASYEAMGGRVYYHGKPHAPIYRESLKRLGLEDSAQVVAIGDSLATDIEGALRAGMGTLFVTGGIYAEELGVEGEAEPDRAALLKLYERHGVTPHAAVTGLRW